MDILQRSIARKGVRSVQACCALGLVLTWGATESLAAPLTFASTSDPSQWQVSTVIGGTDGALSSFSTANFTASVGLSKFTDGIQWIANNSTGTNGTYPGSMWVFFVFRQTFDLTGYAAATAHLQFQWAADDSGENYAQRGSWVPKYSLNGGSLIPWGSGPTYSFGPTVNQSIGFVSGLNTIDFYVEGNSVTDGFALKTVDFTATPVPEPESYAMLLAGLGLLGLVARRGKRNSA